MSNHQKIIKIALIDINAWKLGYLNLLIPIAQEDGIILEITSTSKLSKEGFENFNLLLISEQVSCNDSKTLKKVVRNNKNIIGIIDTRESRGFFKRFKIEAFINIREHSSIKAWGEIKKLLNI